MWGGMLLSNQTVSAAQVVERRQGIPEIRGASHGREYTSPQNAIQTILEEKFKSITHMVP